VALVAELACNAKSASFAAKTGRVAANVIDAARKTLVALHSVTLVAATTKPIIGFRRRPRAWAAGYLFGWDARS